MNKVVDRVLDGGGGLNPRILLVENDVRLANLLKLFFQVHHIELYIVSDFIEMQSIRQQYVFDMYLIDINLPGKSGIDICCFLRGSKDNKPVIMLTAGYNEALLENSLNAGADDFLNKPFNPFELLTRVRKLLDPCILGIKSV